MHTYVMEVDLYKRLCVLTFQKLEDLLEEGKPILAQLNDYGQQVAGYTADEGLSDIINKQNKQFSNVAEQVKRIADKVNLQRHKSMEVGHNLFCVIVCDGKLHSILLVATYVVHHCTWTLLCRTPLFIMWSPLQMLNEIDGLQEWFHDAEHNLMDAEPPSIDPEKLRKQLKEHKVGSNVAVSFL